MDDSVQLSGEVARTVFAGLVPSIPAEETHPQERASRPRMPRGAYATGSVLLVGSMAAMTLNLTGPLPSAEARQQPGPKGTASQPRPTVTVREAPATISSPTAAPASYRVAEGDTVSSIAGRFGLSTASVLASNGLGWSSLIFPGQELVLGGTAPTLAVAEVEAPEGGYTIVVGDTISSIADRFGVSTLSVLVANGLGWDSIIYPGQSIVIPGLVGPGDIGAVEIAPVEVIEPTPAEPTPVVAEAPAAPAPVSGSYTILSGDTVGSIAARYGITTQAIFDANGLDWSSVIFTGHTLVIPGVATPAVTTASTGPSLAGLTDEMSANAAVIVAVGRELGVSDYGIVIALATAMQESTLRNLDWGDRDSVGLFQQRPSAGWGSVDLLTTPDYAARLFFGGASNPNRGSTRGLLDISGWESMSLTEAAQRVQISAYPDAYAKWEASAWSWLTQLG